MRVRYEFSSRMTGRARMGDRTQRKEVPEIITELIRISDVVLEVLDARFLEKTRNKSYEQKVLDAGKILVFVVNKIDMVDVDKLKNNPILNEIKPYVFISSKTRKGLRELRERIKIEIKRAKIDESKGFHRAQIGIIGYPNTGKSTLINILTGSGAARASPTAGFTKGLQKVRMTKDILIIDSPGVIPEEEDSNLDNESLKKHAEIGVKMFDKVKDPEYIVYSLMKEHPGVIEKHYKIEANGDAELLLEKLGKELKLLKKGGEVDLDRTARVVLKDWQKGNIKL